MPPSPTPQAWAQIRYEYEQTRRTVEDICDAQGISPNTLRRHGRRWGWTMRQPPISDEGPPARAQPDFAAAEPSPHIAEPADARPATERLTGAAGRVMRAIETTSARLTTGTIHLRETEMAARALGSLTRTLRDLNELLAQQQAKEPHRSVDELRQSVARKLEAIIAEGDTKIPERYNAAWNEFAAEAKQAAEPVL